ncbi:MAG TPA: iron ABC transporter permease [bacterium]|nr:iron ABC transporter permease [bacterium]
MASAKSKKTYFLLLFLFSAAVLLVVPLVGTGSVDLSDITGILNSSDKSAGQRIFWDVRLPRILIAFMAGSVLAVCGVSFQAMFRNPLATPFTLGVSGGAAFGAVLAIRLGIVFSCFGISSTHIFAFGGAMASIFLVYGIARAHRGFTVATMLLTGVAVSFFFSALIMFIQYIADFSHSFSMVRWMMGNLAVVGYKEVVEMAVLSTIGVSIIFFKRSEMNLLTTGDEIAAGRGVDVERVRKIIFFAVSISAGSVVAVCGPIGFVGLMIPHIMRLIFGADHFDLTPACLLGGGVFLVICDTFARTIISPAEIPIGVITAMLGGPFFVWLLFRHPN